MKIIKDLIKWVKEKILYRNTILLYAKMGEMEYKFRARSVDAYKSKEVQDIISLLNKVGDGNENS